MVLYEAPGKGKAIGDKSESSILMKHPKINHCKEDGNKGNEKVIFNSTPQKNDNITLHVAMLEREKLGQFLSTSKQVENSADSF